jgi:hypothetical protein
VAGIGIDGKRLLPAMREAFEFSAQAQVPAHLGCYRCHAEYIVGACRDAFFLAFATIPVDDGPHRARRLLAVWFLNVQCGITWMNQPGGPGQPAG